MRYPTLAFAISLAIAWSPPGALAIDFNAAEAREAASSYLASLSIAKTHSASFAEPTDLASARAAVLAGGYSSKLYIEIMNRCPTSCSSAGMNTSSWYTYHDIDRIKACNKTMLLDFALFNHVDDSNLPSCISACTSDLKPSTHDAQSKADASACVPKGVQQRNTTSPVQLLSSGDSSSAHVADVVAALDQLQAFSTQYRAGCNEFIKYAYSGDSFVGVYVGSGLTRQNILPSVLKKLSSQLKSDGSVSEELVVQLCSKSSARYSLGIFTNTKGHLGSVQSGLQSWKNGSCITTTHEATPAWQETTYLIPASLHSNSSTATMTSTTALPRWKPIKSRDSACRTIQVEPGDSCDSLASECGITAADFLKFNPSPTLCGSLKPGQHVCCSPGTLPDFSPKPDAKGYCYPYLVKSGDSCSSLAAAYDISNDDIEKFNQKTWGWNGCQKLFADYTICLSSGYPPMPAPVANAVCGPQVNNTAPSPPGTDLSQLNQCPLNACCNIWGQCGTTSEFCTPSNSSTGAPGTAAPGENGCISNCGTDIIISDAPSETFHIAYFEGFDWKRPCLRMSVSEIDTSAYTHIHFSFITLNKDFSINSDDVADQLPLLQGMVGIRRIVSVGGWDFSTNPDTYMIFRDAVSSDANRKALIANVIKFLNDHDLDGIDWDWEYPNEPDIPGIPAGSEEDTTGYFLMLNELKQKMPAGKTVSITVPASFWYLQRFPIKALSLVVDYIVYMTYDLHGQWDYTNKFVSPGCVSYSQGLGNCLRSHVNLTETVNALSMITKAGVPSNMVAIGLSSYGRSFQMDTPGCWTEQCTFTGPASGAYPGPCTNTAGYISDYEIGLITSQNPSAQVLWDANSYSNIILFNGTQWVAHMNKTNKATRKALYPGLNFLGTADWAVDLQSEHGDGPGSQTNSSSEVIYIDPGIWESATPQVVGPPGATLIWPPMPLSSTTTITFPLWTTTISYSSLTTLTSTQMDGSTSTYPHYVYVSWLTSLTIPPVITTRIPVWGVSLTKSLTTGTIYLTSSIQPPPFQVTITPVISGTTSVISATKTTTIPAGTVIWGTSTYVKPEETETLGGTTTVVSGKTLPPTVITITPNPHPTTVPGTVDPIINPKTPKWTSGRKPEPTAKPDCDGCGSICLLFCDPDCPFCPPGVFPQPGGGSNNNGDDGESSTSTPTGSNGAHTILYETLADDAYPTTLADIAMLSSLASEEISLIRSFLGISSSTTKPTSTPTPTPPPKPTPKADCDFWDEGWGWTFEIYNIDGWSMDKGDSLHHEEKGCGALTGWDYHEADSTTFAYTYFNLPFFIKDGCVERAIVSAGGPKISCKGHSIFERKRSGVNSRASVGARARVRANAVPPHYSDEQVKEFERIYAHNTSYRSYSPLNWATDTSKPTMTPAPTITTR
ncbi:putative chitinase [Microsporum ferrugineum]